ncbi:hypothetical protein [Acidianus manzaensis]|uniref:Uncharacterized protein n=1 Tax=Acidianus manzaensis TaxID=282676 RepID=A0A1W6JZX9_9CREN|nr:hypothetical protein [Acidianus manzaensis]ARM75819.1 hypothetical protein B6F84_07055 [Acidianus manzaensis]
MLKSLSSIIILLILLTVITSYSYTSTQTFHFSLHGLTIQVIINSKYHNIVNLTFNNFTYSLIIQTKYNITTNNSIILNHLNDSYILNDADLCNYNSTYNLIIINGTNQIGIIEIKIGSPDYSSPPFSSNPFDTNNSKAADSKSNQFSIFTFIIIGIIAIFATIFLRVLKQNK